ncbi:hypothetical protein FACS18949_13030 [Clostridia bacterium]|nr:hypothetical protein FACS18949_13030 [Clostridia bacterium]
MPEISTPTFKMFPLADIDALMLDRLINIGWMLAVVLASASGDMPTNKITALRIKANHFLRFFKKTTSFAI